MRKHLIGLAALGALAFAGCATEEKKLPSFTQASARTDTVTVTALDQKTRVMTVMDQAGHRVTFKVGEIVRNLPQVQVGDTITVTYQESLGVKVVKAAPGAEPSLVVDTSAARAEPGQMPVGQASGTVTVTANIEAIDRDNNLVTVLGPEGNYRVIHVQNPKNLENVVVGDQVVVTYTEALVTYVEAGPGK